MICAANFALILMVITRRLEKFSCPKPSKTFKTFQNFPRPKPNRTEPNLKLTDGLSDLKFANLF